MFDIFGRGSPFKGTNKDNLAKTKRAKLQHFLMCCQYGSGEALGSSTFVEVTLDTLTTNSENVFFDILTFLCK